MTTSIKNIRSRSRMNAIQLMIKKMIENSHSLRLTESQLRLLHRRNFDDNQSCECVRTKLYLKHFKRKKLILFYKKDVDFAKADHERNNN